MPENRYHSRSQQRVLQVLLLLGGHEVNGLSLTDINESLGISPSQAKGDLENLRIAGVAEQMDTKRWRLTPRVPQIAVAMLNSIDRSERKLSEIKLRYTRDPS